MSAPLRHHVAVGVQVLHVLAFKDEPFIRVPIKQGRQEAGRERHREKQRERRAVGRGQQGWAGIQGRLSAMQ